MRENRWLTHTHKIITPYKSEISSTLFHETIMMYLLHIRSYAVEQTGESSIATACDKPYHRAMQMMPPEWEEVSDHCLEMTGIDLLLFISVSV